MTVDRLVRHAELYGPEDIFTATRRARSRPSSVSTATLRRLGCRSTKAEQEWIEKARSAGGKTPTDRRLRPMAHWWATPGWSRPSPLDARVLSLTDGDPDRTVTDSPYGAHRPVTCAASGREFKAVMKMARYSRATCRQRARRAAR